jgi:hypothetical protein
VVHHVESLNTPKIFLESESGCLEKFERKGYEGHEQGTDFDRGWKTKGNSGFVFIGLNNEAFLVAFETLSLTILYDERVWFGLSETWFTCCESKILW